MIAAVIQMNCEPGNIRKNVAAARDFIRKAADKGAEWAVLPELFQTGYLLGGRDREYAGPVPGGEAVCWMEETAREFGIMLTGGIIEEQGGKLYDTAVTVSQHGLLGAYRKIHLWGGERSASHRETIPVRPWTAEIGRLACKSVTKPVFRRAPGFRC